MHLFAVAAVSAGIESEIRDIVLQLGEIIGRSDLIDLGALEPAAGDPPVVVGDNRLLVEACDWAPAFTLERGLRETVDWWKGPAVA